MMIFLGKVCTKIRPFRVSMNKFWTHTVITNEV